VPFAVATVMMWGRAVTLRRLRNLDGLTSAWLRASFVLSASVLVTTLFILATGFSLFTTRYQELPWLGSFDPVVWWAEVGARQVDALLAGGVSEPGDVGRFVEATEASSRPAAQLIYASVAGGPGGRPVVWWSREQEEGRVAAAFKIADARGVFLLSIDRVHAALIRMDTYNTLVTLVVFLGLVLALDGTFRGVVAAPVGRLQEQLRSAAALLDAGGRLRGRRWRRGGGPEPGPGPAARAGDRPLVGEAVQRILLLLSQSAGVPFRGGAGGGYPSDEAGSEPPPSLAEPPGGPAEGEPLSANPSLADEQRRALRMVFSPLILNHSGTLAWASRRVPPSLQLSACHLLLVKLRVPETVVRKETFVAWAQGVLGEHPRMPFHCPERAMGALNAALALLRQVEDGAAGRALGGYPRFALAVAALAAHLGSVGRADSQLVREGHPLALTYFNREPQASASVAQALRIASRDGCDIFERVPGPARAGLVDLVLSAVVASQPWALPDLAEELDVHAGVAASQLAVRELQGPAGPAPGAGPGPGAGDPPGPSLEPSDGLLVRVLAALAQQYHLWGSHEDRLTWAKRALDQALLGSPAQDAPEAGRPPVPPSPPSPGASAVDRRVASARAQLVTEVTGDVIPLLSRIVRAFPRLAGLARALEDADAPVDPGAWGTSFFGAPLAPVGVRITQAPPPPR